MNFLNDHSRFRVVAKSRQIGFSWTIANECLHTITTVPNKKVNIVSINQKEASDKVDYAKATYHSIPVESGFKPPIYTSAEFEFSLHMPPYTSYIVSQPSSSAIRGGEKDIYLDEAAFIRDANKLYEAAIPATTRGNSRMTVVSTPLGQSGLFFDIAKDRNKYPEYSVHIVPWWECSIMSIDVLESIALAPDFDTETRVRRWGTPSIQSIYNSMDMDAFQQEYECSFADESVSYFPWELITSCVDDTLKNNDPWKPGVQYSLGIDIARKVDKTVVVVSSVDEDTGVRTLHRLWESQDTYEEQAQTFESLIESIKPVRVTIDATGVGAVIAERLRTKYGGIVEPVVFTLQNKEIWATKFKGDLQSNLIRMPRNRSLLQEIHGLERKKSEAGNYLYRAKDNGHDDYLWSTVLSLYGEGRTTPRIGFAW